MTRYRIIARRNPSHPYCGGHDARRGESHYQGKCATDWNLKDGEWRRTFPRQGVYAKVWMAVVNSGRWAWTVTKSDTGDTIGDLAKSVNAAKAAATEAVNQQRWILRRGSEPHGENRSNPSRVVRRRKGWCKLASGRWVKDSAKRSNPTTVTLYAPCSNCGREYVSSQYDRPPWRCPSCRRSNPSGSRIDTSTMIAIRSLRYEAAVHRDHGQVEICDRAIRGSRSAAAECLRVIKLAKERRRRR